MYSLQSQNNKKPKTKSIFEIHEGGNVIKLLLDTLYYMKNNTICKKFL